jgi:hypothetical protein
MRGDFRDWAVITQWADSIAADMTARYRNGEQAVSANSYTNAGLVSSIACASGFMAVSGRGAQVPGAEGSARSFHCPAARHRPRQQDQDRIPELAEQDGGRVHPVGAERVRARTAGAAPPPRQTTPSGPLPRRERTSSPLRLAASARSSSPGWGTHG